MIKAEIIKRFNEAKDFREKLIIAAEFMQFAYLLAKSEKYDISVSPPDYEIWRNVIGYEGVYQISSFGRFKSLERFFIKKNSGSNGLKAVYKPEILRTIRYTNQGYPKISLWDMGTVKHCLIHRLVASHFINNPKKYKQVGHLDNNPANPKWDNLVWGTQKMNINYAVKCGRWHTGSKNFQTKLKDTDIPEIRKLLSDGVSSHKIGKRFNVNHCTILSIKNNETWKHIN